METWLLLFQFVCAWTSVCVCFWLTVCRSGFVLYALSKESSSLSQHIHAHTVTSQLFFTHQLPMGNPSPSPLCVCARTCPHSHVDMHTHAYTLLLSHGSIQTWPRAWHTAKTTMLATPDTKLAFPQGVCVCVCVSVSVRAWVFASVRVSVRAYVCVCDWWFRHYSSSSSSVAVDAFVCVSCCNSGIMNGRERIKWVTISAFVLFTYKLMISKHNKYFHCRQSWISAKIVHVFTRMHIEV